MYNCSWQNGKHVQFVKSFHCKASNQLNVSYVDKLGAIDRVFMILKYVFASFHFRHRQKLFILGETDLILIELENFICGLQHLFPYKSHIWIKSIALAYVLQSSLTNFIVILQNVTDPANCTYNHPLFISHTCLGSFKSL